MEKKCCYCEEVLTPKTHTQEHLIPLSRGGNSSKEFNLKPCCKKCNSERGNKSLTTYAASLSENIEKYPTSFNREKQEKKIENVLRWLEYVRQNKDRMRKSTYSAKIIPETIEPEPEPPFDFQAWLIRYRAEPDPNFHFDPPK